ncbi:neuraminidase-like domain-containing protein [Kaistia terrae]|uniref:Neuraminidase-like domain-containing protein n=1 Tax=Kaistia terrae TaxID=537017 RepID=A0ABW0Q0B5_9HYPH|nr:neuraminidase-like domain-containing protein [Kaistia terrae]MCX5578925.1 hypothetical protein [Kaistia terrae]
MPNPSLRFFIYLNDQTNTLTSDVLGPVDVEFYEHQIDGTDTQFKASIDGVTWTTSLQIKGATEVLTPSGTFAGWHPWADVSTVYVKLPSIPLDPTQRYKAVLARVQLQRSAGAKGDLDLCIVVKRGGTEIGRSELFRNCRTDLSDISPVGVESLVWIAVPSVGNEVVSRNSALSEYERVRSEAAQVLANESLTFDLIPEATLDATLGEIAAQSVAGIDSIGLPPKSPAKIQFNPDSLNAGTLRLQGLRLAREATLTERLNAIEHATSNRAQLLSALNCGLQCQRWTSDVAKAGLFHWWIEANPGASALSGAGLKVRVEVTGIPANILTVPAGYFYAIGRNLDPRSLPIDYYNAAAGGLEDVLRQSFRRSKADRVIDDSIAPILETAEVAGAALNHRLAARRLHGLPALDLDGNPEPGTDAAAVTIAYSDVKDLFDTWLALDDTDAAFWGSLGTLTPLATQQHAALVLAGISASIHHPRDTSGLAKFLATQPQWNALPDLASLKAKTSQNWEDAFNAYWASITPVPGDLGLEAAERQQRSALFALTSRFTGVGAPPPAAPVPVAAMPFAGIAAAAGELQRFLDDPANANFLVDQATTAAIIVGLHKSDGLTRDLLELYFLHRVVTQAIVPASHLVSVMEALHFRGFVTPQSVSALTEEQFAAALVGTLAYADAAGIHAAAAGLPTIPAPRPLALYKDDLASYPDPVGGQEDEDIGAVDALFRPVNHDGLLTDCLPAEHLSPFGPAAYLKALQGFNTSLSGVVDVRRGPLGQLEVSAANTFTPVPVVDLVNEALETLVGQAEGNIDTHPNGEVPQGAPPKIFQTGGGLNAARLDAVPQHSSPTSPDAIVHKNARALQDAAYAALKTDFSAFARPYDQPLDVTRTYLEHLGTSRYETMRTFRKDIHEFVKEPQDLTNPKLFQPYLPPQFDAQTHIYRYPVRIEIAREYLGLTEIEHREVFTESLASSRQKLWQFWGYLSKPGNGHNDSPKWADWNGDQPAKFMDDPDDPPPRLRRLPEFLKRAELSYAELLQLVACGFLPISAVDHAGVAKVLPPTEPHDPDEYVLVFGTLSLDVALERLAVFLRLRRLLKRLPHGGYSFEGIVRRLSGVRQQLLAWPAGDASCAALRSRANDFLDHLASDPGATIPPTERAARQQDFLGAFAALRTEMAPIVDAALGFANLEIRITNLSASSHSRVTAPMRQAASEAMSDLATAGTVRDGYLRLSARVDEVADAMLADTPKMNLMHGVRQIRVQLADLIDGITSLKDFAASLQTLDGLLSAAAAQPLPPVARTTKVAVAAVQATLVRLPAIDAEASATSGRLDTANHPWAPQGDAKKLPGEFEALIAQLRGNDADTGLKAFAKLQAQFDMHIAKLTTLPKDDTFAPQATKATEAFLTTFNADALQDEIAAATGEIRTKLDALPAYFPSLGAALAALADLRTLLAAESVDGTYSRPLATVEDFIRRWNDEARQDHTFAAARHIAEELSLYHNPLPSLHINTDFIRQLAALQMLRDDYNLCLTDVLPLWRKPPVGNSDPVTAQAKADLALVIQERADRSRSTPKSRPLTSDDFDQIADLNSLRPGAPGTGGAMVDDFPAFSLPTLTLRFVETCFKIAHSEFSVGELVFLYLNRHLPSDDPFFVAADADARAQPFADAHPLADGADASLLRLQKLIRGAAYGSITKDHRPDGLLDRKPVWGGAGDDRRDFLKNKLGYDDPDLNRLDRVFRSIDRLPSIWTSGDPATTWTALAASLDKLGYGKRDIEELKHIVAGDDSPTFSASLTNLTGRVLVTGVADFDVPFSYDAGKKELVAAKILDSEDILSEVTRLRSVDKTAPLGPCDPDEVAALRDLYEQPRRTLTRFALILPDQREAARRILTPEKAADRLEIVVRYFYVFYRQHLVVADHLAAHVLGREPKAGSDPELDQLSEVARFLLVQRIEAEENWKDNTGTFNYPNGPNGKSIAGILGLRGTGIRTTFKSFMKGDTYSNLRDERFDKYVSDDSYGQLPLPVAPLAWDPFPDVYTLTAPKPLVWELSGSLNYLQHPNDDPTLSDQETHDWLYNAPKPLRVPEPVNHKFLPQIIDGKAVELRSGYEVRIENVTAADTAHRSARSYGGGMPFQVIWNGMLQVPAAGDYFFAVTFKLQDDETGPFKSTPFSNLTDDGAKFTFDTASIAVTAHHFSKTHSDDLQSLSDTPNNIYLPTPAGTTIAAPGLRELQLTFVDFAVDPSVFEISKNSPDRHVAWVGAFWKAASLAELPPEITYSFKGYCEIPAEALFVEKKDADDFLDVRSDKAFFYPEPYYFSSVRDIRRSYQRAFKALLFCHRFALMRDEVRLLLSRGKDFRGISYSNAKPTAPDKWAMAEMPFDFNLWSVGDPYYAPAEAQDVRQWPESHMPDRVWPLFDQWERFHDYVDLRDSVTNASEPLYGMFEQATAATAIADVLVQNGLGLDTEQRADGLLFTTDVTPDFSALDRTALINEQWPVRIWRVARWQERKRRHIATPKPALPAEYRSWARLTPDVDSLRAYINDIYLRHGPIRRYRNLAELNWPLRNRARASLVGYLTSLDRCSFPHLIGAPHFARRARDLSELLLLDVEAGPTLQAPRIESAAASFRTLVQRLRLGLEANSGIAVGQDFFERWDTRFADYRRWEAGKYHAAYAENYREADLVERAAGTETFKLLEHRLPAAELALDQDWSIWPSILPAIPDLIRWELRIPSDAQPLNPPREGYHTLDRRDRKPRQTALSAPVTAIADDAPPEKRMLAAIKLLSPGALELDRRFVRLQFSTRGRQDDYYFWLVDGTVFNFRPQSATDKWEVPENSQDHLAGIPSALTAWPTGKLVRLAWTRFSDGIAGDVRISDYGIVLRDKAAPDLKFRSRDGDTLVFNIDGAEKADQAFVYLPVPDLAVIAVAPAAAASPPAGGLPSYPHFMATAPGAPASPGSFHAPALLLQKYLRSRQRFDAARTWLEYLYRPLRRSNGWTDHKGLLNRSNSRAFLLAWLECVLDCAEFHLAEHTLASSEISRETLALVRKVLGARPRRVAAPDQDTKTLEHFSPDPTPLNRRLLQAWSRAERIEATLESFDNDHRLRNAALQSRLQPAPGELPPYGYGCLGKGWMAHAPYAEVGPDRDEWLLMPPNYRFSVLVQRALEFTSEVRALGALLLAAFEKGDAEQLNALRIRHETQVNRLTLDVRQSQWRESDWQLQTLEKQRLEFQTRKAHIEQLIRAGNNSGERGYFRNQQDASVMLLTSKGFDLTAQLELLSIPEVYVGVCSMVKVVSGQKYAAATRLGGTILEALASKATIDAAIDLQNGSFARRLEEWIHQVALLTIQIEQVDRQILAAGRRRDISLRELNIHQDTIAQSEELQRLQQSKFSSVEHFLWSQAMLSALHRSMFEVAMVASKAAEAAFRYERHYAPSRFLNEVGWVEGREGMAAGESLTTALRRMEQAYLIQNEREHELGKSISLRVYAPEQLNALRLTGLCEVDLPEWIFDLEQPGQYRRRIKSVAISVLCSTGPYQSVNATLTLLSDAVRISPEMQPHYQEDVSLGGDPRFVRRYAAHQSIVTTSAENDTGLFETDLRDERYLPFEGAGVISRWRIELDPATNQFDTDTLTDVVLHVRYTSTDGGAELRRHAHAAASAAVPGVQRPAVKFIDVRHDLPAQWSGLVDAPRQAMSLRLDRDMFFWARRSPDVAVEGVEVFLKPVFGSALPTSLLLALGEQEADLALIDLGYGPVYHGRTRLVDKLHLPDATGETLTLNLSAPGPDQRVPQPDVLLILLDYTLAAGVGTSPGASWGQALLQ